MEKSFGKFLPPVAGNRLSTSARIKHLQSLSLKCKNTFYGIPQDEICLFNNHENQDPARISEEMIEAIRRQYVSLKLRKIMAVEIIKNRVKGDLKRIVKQIDVCSNINGPQEFVILGGGTKSLSYHKKDGILEVDVRGYIADNVSVDTEFNRMSIKATKVNGAEKCLGILAPSSGAMEKVKIYPPKKGFLVLKYPNN